MAGGGPAGLAAAAEAAAAGHDVVLFEASPQLGGQVWLAGNAPGHRELCESLLRNYRNMLDRPNVRIELGVAADVDTLRQAACDAVVVATGARPYVPPFALADVEVLSAWEVLGGVRPAGRVVIAEWGGDAIALDCAELLAAEGLEVTLATGAVTAGEHLHQYMRNALPRPAAPGRRAAGPPPAADRRRAAGASASATCSRRSSPTSWRATS